jgi:hypothetical protein
LPDLPGDQPCQLDVPFTVDVTGLPADTLIYFRAYATNGQGPGYAESTFNTDGPPTVASPTFAGVGDTFATLGGTLTSENGDAVTECGVEWGTSPGSYPNQVPDIPGDQPCQLDVPFTVDVTGLPAGVPVYFRAYATNAVGTGYAEGSFSTNGPPTVTSPTFAGVTDTTATLGGTLTSENGSTVTECGVEWGTSPGTYPNPVPDLPGDQPCQLDVPFTVDVSGLPSGTLIYFRAYATSAGGTGTSAQSSFTTHPTVTSPTFTGVTDTTATLGGTVSSDGSATVTARGVEWGTSPGSYPNQVPAAVGGTGTFTVPVTGLPGSTQIYFRAYAINAGGTGYSVESDFPTQSAPEPTVQASNVVFSRISGRAFTIDWTRGNGDGSIVVLRLDATAKTDPADGNDYTPEPDLRDPPTELPVNSENYVVHKGPESSVWVTGLALDTIYSVVVYEYTNSGANTDYLLTPPAVGSNEGTQATGTVPTHNEDFRADCAKCHYHGSFNSRGDDLTPICEGCHNPLGDAANKLDFANHLGPSNPDVDFVDCGVCHELHLTGTTHTMSTHPVTLETQANKSFVRSNVDKYVPGAAPPAFLHTDDPGNPDPPNNAITPDRAIEGDTGGYCQVCHTITEYHRNTVSAEADQCHDGNQGNCGPAETQCGTCHWHSNSFQGVGGSVSCIECHDSQQPDQNPTRPIITTQFDRLSTHVPGGSAAVTQPDCQVCHNFGSHYGQKINVFNLDDGTTQYEQPTLLGDPLATGEGEEFQPHCLSCHGDSVAASLAASGGDQTQTSPFTGSDLTTTNVARIDATSWAFAAHNRPSGSFPSSPVTCIGNGANGCHASGHGSESNDLLASWDGVSDPNLGTPASSAPVSPLDFCYN